MGELSVSCAYPTFLAGVVPLAQTHPIKPFKINRVPVNANNCSCLASRMKRPAKLPVNWICACRAVYVMPEKRVARLGASICGRGNSLRGFNYMLNCELGPTTSRCAFGLAI